MSTTTTTSLLGDLLLARLLPPCKRAVGPTRLRASLQRLGVTALSVEHWQAVVDELTAAGLVETRPLRLTDAGRARALEFLGIDALPPEATWKTIQDRYLVPRAVGAADDEATRRRISKYEGLAAILVRRHYDLPSQVSLTPAGLLEAVVCKELGYPEATTLGELSAHVLGGIVGDGRQLKPADCLKKLCGQVLNVPEQNLGALRAAVLAQWAENACQDEEVLHRLETPAEEAREEDVQEKIATDLPVFAATVLKVGRGCPAGWLTNDRLLLQPLWEQLRQEPGFGPLELDDFKRYLLEAHHAGLLDLGQAEPGESGDSSDVSASEVRDQDGTCWHLLRVERERAESERV